MLEHATRSVSFLRHRTDSSRLHVRVHGRPSGVLEAKRRSVNTLLFRIEHLRYRDFVFDVLSYDSLGNRNRAANRIECTSISRSSASKRFSYLLRFLAICTLERKKKKNKRSFISVKDVLFLERSVRMFVLYKKKKKITSFKLVSTGYPRLIKIEKRPLSFLFSSYFIFLFCLLPAKEATIVSPRFSSLSLVAPLALPRR